MKTFFKISLSVLLVMMTLVSFAQKSNNSVTETKIYNATSRYNADFTYNGKILYNGTNLSTSNKNFLWQDKKVYEGKTVGCTVKYHMSGSGFYKGKAPFDDDLLYTIDGNKAYVKKTNEIAFTYDGQVLYDKDSSTLLLRADKKDTVPFQMMITAWFAMQF